MFNSTNTVLRTGVGLCFRHEHDGSIHAAAIDGISDQLELRDYGRLSLKQKVCVVPPYTFEKTSQNLEDYFPTLEPHAEPLSRFYVTPEPIRRKIPNVAHTGALVATVKPINEKEKETDKEFLCGVLMLNSGSGSQIGELYVIDMPAPWPIYKSTPCMVLSKSQAKTCLLGHSLDEQLLRPLKINEQMNNLRQFKRHVLRMQDWYFGRPTGDEVLSPGVSTAMESLPVARQKKNGKRKRVDAKVGLQCKLRKYVSDIATAIAFFP